MIYIYDQIVERELLEYEYMGTTYELAGKSIMGKMVYYSYKKEGAEQLLLISGFAEQFLEAAKRFWKIRDVTSNSAAQIRIRRTFGVEPDVDEFVTSKDEIYYYTTNYKDIRITMQLENGKFFLQPVFVIVKNNVFGDFVTVDVRENERLYQYCEKK